MMETNDIVRKVAAEMLNTSMQDISAEVIYGWATRLGEVAVSKMETTTPTCKESRQVGNAEAMREALVQCELFLGNVSRHGHPTLNPGDKCTACDGVDELRGMVVRALSAPPRNCDRFSTFADALEAWRELDPREAGVFDEWLFAEAKGEAK